MKLDYILYFDKNWQWNVQAQNKFQFRIVLAQLIFHTKVCMFRPSHVNFQLIKDDKI